MSEPLLHHVVNAEGYINTSYVSRERAESIVENLRDSSPQTFRVVVAEEQPADLVRMRSMTRPSTWFDIVDAVTATLARHALSIGYVKVTSIRRIRARDFAEIDRLQIENKALADRLMTMDGQRADLLERCRQADASTALPELSTGEVRRALGIGLLGDPDA